MIYGSISGALWFLVFLLLKICAFHSFQIKNKSGLIIKLFIGAVIGCVFSSLLLGRSAVEILIGSIVMLSFFILYMPFYYVISSSVSIQTLILLSDRDTHTLDELTGTFASREVVSYKLRSMINSNLLLSSGQKYKITPKGKLVAGIFGSIKRVWKLGPGG